MRSAGFEPAREYSHQILSLAHWTKLCQPRTQYTFQFFKLKSCDSKRVRMADYERISELKMMISEETNPDRIDFLKVKLEKVQNYIPDVVTNKIRELTRRGLMDHRGNLVGINSLGKIGSEPGKNVYNL